MCWYIRGLKGACASQVTKPRQRERARRVAHAQRGMQRTSAPRHALRERKGARTAAPGRRSGGCVRRRRCKVKPGHRATALSRRRGIRAGRCRPDVGSAAANAAATAANPAGFWVHASIKVHNAPAHWRRAAHSPWGAAARAACGKSVCALDPLHSSGGAGQGQALAGPPAHACRSLESSEWCRSTPTERRRTAPATESRRQRTGRGLGRAPRWFLLCALRGRRLGASAKMGLCAAPRKRLLFARPCARALQKGARVPSAKGHCRGAWPVGAVTWHMGVHGVAQQTPELVRADASEHERQRLMPAYTPLGQRERWERGMPPLRSCRSCRGRGGFESGARMGLRRPAAWGCTAPAVRPADTGKGTPA